jgi:hypothetical protein
MGDDCTGQKREGAPRPWTTTSRGGGHGRGRSFTREQKLSGAGSHTPSYLESPDRTLTKALWKENAHQRGHFRKTSRSARREGGSHGPPV